MTFPFSSLSPLQNTGPCNSFYCLDHFKNVYDDDDDDDDGDIAALRCGVLYNRTLMESKQQTTRPFWTSTCGGG